MTRKKQVPQTSLEREEKFDFSPDDLGDLASSVESMEGPDDLPGRIMALDNEILQSIVDSVDASTDGADRVLSEGSGDRPTAWELAKWTNSDHCPRPAKKEMCERLSQVLQIEVNPPVALVGGLIFTKNKVISIVDLHEDYRRAVDEGRSVTWPVAPLVTAWQNPPNTTVAD